MLIHKGGLRGASSGLAIQRRLFSTKLYLPDTAYRRPNNSSWAFRGVQDWKPAVVKTAHLQGRDAPPEGTENVRLHMVIIDPGGFRWPIVFYPEGGMTLWHCVNLCDQAWMDLLPPSVKTPDAMYELKDIQDMRMNCDYLDPIFLRCVNCAVVLPYEYMEAMDPMNVWECAWLLQLMRLFMAFFTANTRLACQVIIEEWMDGMTVVLPQLISMGYQFYIQHAADKESINENLSDLGGHMNAGLYGEKSYTWRPPGGPGTAFPTDALEALRWVDDMDHLNSRMEPRLFGHTGGHGHREPALRDIFWTDFVDDIIREADPKHDGRYALMKY